MDGCEYRLNTGLKNIYRCERGENQGLVTEDNCKICRYRFDINKNIPNNKEVPVPKKRCKTCKEKRKDWKGRLKNG